MTRTYLSPYEAKMKISTAGGAVVFAFLLGATGCSGVEAVGESREDLAPAPTPVPGTPATLDTLPTGAPYWRSLVDNPPMTGTYQLTGSQIIQSNSNGWAETYFDLRAQGLLNSGTILDYPTSTTTTKATAPDAMNWMSRGLTLPPRLTGAASEGLVSYAAWVDDASVGPFLRGSASVYVQLDPNVILVPVVVEQLYDGVNAQDGWYPEEDAIELLDNAWFIKRSVTSNPSAHPYQVVSQWGFQGSKDGTQTQGVAAEPDSIWTQCNIQFRKVKYVSCKADSDAWVNLQPTPAGCDGTTFVQRVLKAADAGDCGKASLIQGTLRLILSGPYENPGAGCTFNTYGQTTRYDTNVFVNTGGLTTYNVVAHELGHALGLGEDLIDSTDLMYQYAGTSTQLSADLCATARATAMKLQANYAW